MKVNLALVLKQAEEAKDSLLRYKLRRFESLGAETSIELRAIAKIESPEFEIHLRGETEALLVRAGFDFVQVPLLVATLRESGELRKLYEEERAGYLAVLEKIRIFLGVDECDTSTRSGDGQEES